MARPRPIIGINCDYRQEERACSFLYPAYQKAVEAAGGIPMLIPPLSRPADIDQLLEHCDGLLLTGGDDIDPRHYGQEVRAPWTPVAPQKEAADFRLVRSALGRDVPMLAVCYGMQLLGVVSGGTLVQDLATGPDRVRHHLPDELARHEVRAAPGSRLSELFSGSICQTNSKHHQAVASVGASLSISGKTVDDVVEAIESPNHRFVLGVQWHPELERESASGSRLFESLIAACR
ncbi:MAG: gamma-glutamyl-gamma-aminobutyrate hydrolase family protein [Planctomycetota bacterium]